jgi:hypothetical protein
MCRTVERGGYMIKIRWTLLSLIVIWASLCGFNYNAFAENRTIKIKIPSCLCGNTMITVRIAGPRIEGVIAVLPNPLNQSAIFTFDDEKTSFEKIKDALARESVYVLGEPEYLK